MRFVLFVACAVAAFSGSYGGHLRAYSTRTGEIVWDFDAGKSVETVNGVQAKGGSFNGSGPAIAHGMVIATSGFGFAGRQASMCCWHFRLTANKERA
jgi:polyvinyl alcohol dehydrogenase (cytochrome)